MIELAHKKELRLSVNFMMRFGELAEVTSAIVAENLLGSFLRGQVVNCAGDDQLGALPGARRRAR